mmetsp:Transcript_132177/g.313350  ORF Transcript_132177/g.313350 Transcript_132177/m.313350 type:complete len:468 (-) Transcript_132177:142-1545(-)|eukprot:CAMPEP_0181428366 /NCGR_PEP_ID=MMETSP1110-20121109/16642_1 /TAXON_ID=174948 /ORGANISM="Symbiodinium sp., Strain CCMP421" /LENGTH=467 /DNA_ID=CAMNT_0023551591 /DNA_START=132 /DNA_END=1535 /DNA_ORIENTATION=-
MAQSTPTTSLTDSPRTFALLEKAKVQLMQCARRRPSMDLTAAESAEPISLKGWKGPLPPSLLGNRQVLQQPRLRTEKSKEVHALEIDSPNSMCEPCPEPSPAHTSTSSLSSESLESPATRKSSKEAQPPRRPCFRKPSREVRLRQLHDEVRQFCELCFDDVDPFQQQGMTCRMLAFLKSMGRVLSWQDGDVRGETATYEMLGLSKVDLANFEDICDRADDLIEKHRFRQAYEQLCQVRPKFGQGEPATAAASTLPPKKPAVQPKEQVEEELGKQSEPRPAAPGPLPIPPSKTKQLLQAQGNRSSACTVEQPGNIGAGPSPNKSGNQAGAAPAKGKRGQEKSGAGTGGGKYLCRVKVGIEEDYTFQVCRRIIGPGGENMKRIIEGDGSVKIRLRGRGSKYLEGPEHKESTDDLMLCISATNRRSFEKAATGVELLIHSVQQDYIGFCKARGLSAPVLPSVRREAQRSR